MDEVPDYTDFRLCDEAITACIHSLAFAGISYKVIAASLMGNLRELLVSNMGYNNDDIEDCLEICVTNPVQMIGKIMKKQEKENG